MKKIVTLFFVVCLCGMTGYGQVKTPVPSPKSVVTQEVGLSEVKVEYSRPGVKGRTIFGDLVPYGEKWRTGANASTKVTFGDDVRVNGNELKKGTYALFTVPGKSSWDIIFYSDLTSWGVPSSKEYDAEKEVAKFSVEPSSTKDMVETFTIDVHSLKDGEATLALMWEQTKVSMTIELETDKQVMASIDKVMAGPGYRDYLNAARYYHSSGKDMKQALEWINKADELNPGKFWVLRTKSQILGELGEYKQAISAAEESMKLAEEAGNANYVKFNKEAIADWKKKK